jgi:hypothetical protein
MQETEKQQRVFREKDEMLTILDEYFNRGVDKKKFVDVSRIPLICQDISNIHKSLEKIEDNVSWVVKLIVGAVLLGLIALILK